MADELWVTNGESVAAGLRELSATDEVLSWDDVLHVGPLAFDAAESRPLRAAFLADHGWGAVDDIESRLCERDDRLSAAGDVLLWFEHDLYDQLQLLQILAQAHPEATIDLIQSDVHLGPLSVQELAALLPRRRRLSREARGAAVDAWRAVVEGVEAPPVPELPHLRSALRRLAEEREPLSRTKRQLLDSLDHGHTTPLELFAANQRAEEAAFLGDAWCFLFLSELEQDGLVRGELPSPPPRGDYEAFVHTRLELTEDGLAVLAG